MKAVYLHVLTANTQAITFYENRGFQPHLFLPQYYNIKGRRKDGFTYVQYLNGGHPPWNVVDYVVHWCSAALVVLNPWSVARTAIRKLNVAWVHALPRVRRLAHSSVAFSS